MQLKQKSTDLQLKEIEETRGSKGVSPLALQIQTCQKLRKIQGKGLANQGKTKNCMEKNRNGGRRGVLLTLKTETLLQKKEKINIVVQEDFIFFPITVVPP